MQYPKSFKRWMDCLSILLLFMIASVYSGIAFSLTWYILTLPVACIFVAVSIGTAVKLTYRLDDVETMKALDGLYQMEDF